MTPVNNKMFKNSALRVSALQLTRLDEDKLSKPQLISVHVKIIACLSCERVKTAWNGKQFFNKGKINKQINFLFLN